MLRNRSRNLTGAALLLWFSFASPIHVSAEDSEEPPPTVTAEFIAWCNSNAAICGDMTMHHQNLDLLMSTLGARRQVCVPPSLSAEERRMAIVDWIGKHSELSQKPANDSLVAAERNLWPC
jgi:hypothetical protein